MNLGTARIAKTCLRTRMRDPRRSPDTAFRYVDISAIDRSLKVITSVPEILGADAPSRARKEIVEGDVLVSTVRPNLNAVAVVPPELNGQIASTGFCILRPNRAVIDGKYLFYFTTTSYFIGILSGKVRGAHYPAVSDGDVKNIEMPLPTLSEQRRIVEILDQADALRRNRAEADAKAVRILPALFYKMFGDPATNPKGLSKKKLEDLIKVRSGNFLPAKNMDPNGHYPVYGGNGINGYHSEFMFEQPVIVLGRVGIYCGAVHYSEPKCWVTDNALYVAEQSNDLHSRYLAEALRVANLNQYAGRAGQPLISGSRIYPIEILVPPPEKQEVFANRIVALHRHEKRRQDAGDHIERLFSVLLHRAFTGDLTAKWREANMNDLLAEMEQQAKALDVRVEP
ncbi:MAG: restriction endonuclease subunit S [Deltaproteobacteria bacterium]|nr:restriction endonuclease subunit S [Deltaproteobacteria bacterium]MBW2329911.1 restriction endonuclease subunit S [Deltaproteobacteria bacterium]